MNRTPVRLCHGDVLRMQRIARPLHDAEAPALESDAMRAIADFVARDAVGVSSL